jgi:hypothetical protein
MKKFIPLSVFGISFALVEAVVVIYLQRIYYPTGFAFPLKPMPPNLLHVEIYREAATLLMLASAGIAAGKTGWQNFSFFIFLFGIWDIFYYVWLKVFVSWPPSIFTPDLLFLIPVVWQGPVLAPVIVAFSLCVSALIIIKLDALAKPLILKWHDVVLLASGAVVILYTFMTDSSLLEAGMIPPPFRWWIFSIGELLGIIAFIFFLNRNLSNERR